MFFNKKMRDLVSDKTGLDKKRANYPAHNEQREL